MKGIVLTGHGNFATGLGSSVKLIAGMPENFEMVDFPQEYSVEDLAKKLNEAFDKLSKTCDGILVFSDLAGGSPFKTAVEIKMQRSEKIEVISGTNLGMIIEISMARGFMDDLDQLVDMAINTGKDSIMKYAFVERHEDEASDGI